MEYTEVINSSKVVMVEFFASWCPHCQKMIPAVANIKDLLKGSVNVYQYDIDANEELADAEKVNTIPTFIVYQEGKEVWRHSGEMEEQALLSKVKSFL